MKQARSWSDAGLGELRLALNLSGRQFREQNLVQTIRNTLERSGVDPKRVELEVTESIMMEGGDSTLKTLNELKDMGLRLSIADFGTGYSSLSYLKDFPVDSLKIDRSFVREIPHHERDAALMTAIIAMAHSLKLNVIAEGVETDAQLAFLLERGCDEMQGFLFSRPVCAEAFVRLVKDGRHLQAELIEAAG